MFSNKSDKIFLILFMLYQVDTHLKGVILEEYILHDVYRLCCSI